MKAEIEKTIILTMKQKDAEELMDGINIILMAKIPLPYIQEDELERLNELLELLKIVFNK